MKERGLGKPMRGALQDLFKVPGGIKGMNRHHIVHRTLLKNKHRAIWCDLVRFTEIYRDLPSDGEYMK